MAIRVEVIGKRSSAASGFHAFAEGPVTLGRARTCDVVFGSREVSRRQLVLEEQNGCWFAKHLGSTVPTFLNGASLLPYRPVRLSDGDLLTVERQDFRVEIDHEAHLPPRSVPLGQDERPKTASIERMLARTGEYRDGSRGEHPVLVLLKDGWPTREFRCTRDGRRYVFGRSQVCDFTLPDASVSRRHAEVRCQGKDVFAVDLGAKYALRVNDVVVRGEVALVHGDALELGAATLRFEWRPADLEEDLEPVTGPVEVPALGTSSGRPLDAAGEATGAGEPSAVGSRGVGDLVRIGSVIAVVAALALGFLVAC